MVHPDFQKMGLGSALTKYTNDIADKTGVRTWAPARPFSYKMFLHMGFTSRGSTDAHMERWGGSKELSISRMVCRDPPAWGEWLLKLERRRGADGWSAFSLSRGTIVIFPLTLSVHYFPALFITKIIARLDLKYLTHPISSPPTPTPKIEYPCSLFYFSPEHTWWAPTPSDVFSLLATVEESEQ